MYNREKLGIPEDESISIKSVIAKRKEESKKMEELVRQNKNLIEENLELKSDVRWFMEKLIYKTCVFFKIYVFSIWDI